MNIWGEPYNSYDILFKLIFFNSLICPWIKEELIINRDFVGFKIRENSTYTAIPGSKNVEKEKNEKYKREGWLKRWIFY